MEIRYIWHDCFFISSESANLVFDFWMDPLTKNGSMPLFIQNADKNKPFYVFVSHHHKDHYSKRIFEWHSLFNDIHFIISKDTAKYARHILSENSIYKGQKPESSQVCVLTPGETYSDSVISVDAFGSTDIGNSYAVKIDGKTIFHAGDLNAWIWKDESTLQEIEKALNDYESILENILLKHSRFDYVMFPVDSRIGSDYFTGAKTFVRKFDVSHFFPMHFGLGESTEEQLKYQLDANRFTEYANPYRGEYISLQSPYSTFFKNDNAE